MNNDYFWIYKLTISLCILVCFILEYIDIKKYNKGTMRLGIILSISIFCVTSVKLSLLIQLIFLILWSVFLLIFKKIRNKFTYYILPILLFLISYSAGVIYVCKDYSIISISILSKVYSIFLMSCIFSISLYILTYIKYIFYKIKMKDKIKNIIKIHKPNCFLPFLFLPYIILILI